MNSTFASQEQVAFLTELAGNAELIEVARQAIENELIDRRELGLMVMRGNGFVVRHKDGGESPIIRLSTDDGLRIGLRAIATYLSASYNCAFPDCTSYFDEAAQDLEVGDGSRSTGWIKRPGEAKDLAAHDHFLAEPPK